MSSPRPLLRVGALQLPPWSIYKYDQQKVVDLGGIMGNILKIWTEVIKFNYEIVPPPDKLYGMQLKNGTWNGMIGMIQRGKMDIAMYPLAMTPERASVIDFTTPLLHSNVAILSPRPKIEYDIQGVFKPFSYEVWLCTLISLIAISIAIIFFEKVESKLYGYEISDLTAKSLMWSTKALTQEGSLWLPRADGGRLIVATWLLASLIFMSSFSGILIAMLTVPKVTIPVDSLEDLVRQSTISWKMLPGTFIRQFFQQSENIVHQKAYEGIAGTVSSMWMAKKDIINGDYAIINDEFANKLIMAWDYSNNGRCNLYMAREYVYSNILYGLAFKTDSVYFEKCNRIIHSLMEAGILEHWADNFLANSTHCLKSPSYDTATDSILALNLKSFGGSFILLFIGYFIALMVFLLEIIL